MKNLYDIEGDQTAISKLVEKTKKKSLLSSIVWSAMVYLKDHPKDSIQNAVQHAEEEWQK